jgi:hypothetical protein
LAVGLAVLALIADGGAWVDIGAEVEKHRKLRRIGFLAAGQIEGEIGAVKISLQVDFG